MRVTFDSNVWQQLVRPEKFPKDPRNADFVRSQSAVRSGAIEAFIVETVATLEAIPRAYRGNHLANRRVKVQFVESVRPGAIAIHARATVVPDSDHPLARPLSSQAVPENRGPNPSLNSAYLSANAPGNSIWFTPGISISPDVPGAPILM